LKHPVHPDRRRSPNLAGPTFGVFSWPPSSLFASSAFSLNRIPARRPSVPFWSHSRRCFPMSTDLPLFSARVQSLRFRYSFDVNPVFYPCTVTKAPVASSFTTVWHSLIFLFIWYLGSLPLSCGPPGCERISSGFFSYFF